MTRLAALRALVAVLALFAATTVTAQQKKPNVVMLMLDDVGWSDFGAYPGGGKALEEAGVARHQH